MSELDIFCRLAREAGARILAIRGEGADVERKVDDSPVTRADRDAEAIILAGLRAAMDAGEMPHAPIVAEEAVSVGQLPEVRGGRFLLVDPLDGTREFIGGGDDFTVNIATIENGEPVAGVVFQPATGALYAADAGGAWLERRQGSREPLGCTPWKEGDRLTIVASKSHRTAETDAWIGAVETRWGAGEGTSEIAAIGSSLKLCILAEGRAHLYPRIGRTMEWDIAAGDAVLRRAGGAVFEMDGKPLRYGRADGGGADGTDAPFANPHFVASSARFPSLPNPQSAQVVQSAQPVR